jgi:protease I
MKEGVVRTIEGVRVAILVTDLFEESELVEPKKALEEAGARAVVIAPKTGMVQAMRHADKSIQVPVDLTLEKADPADFDAVLLPGGAMNADALRVEKKAQDFVRKMDAAGNPIAVICHAPWLLVSAGLVRGRTMTSYHTIQDDVRCAGANWIDKEVVRDRNWVSSRKPDDIPVFNHETIALIAEWRRRHQEAA